LQYVWYVEQGLFSEMHLTNLGIVSLLFCGISLKHYAYYNMSRRTQLSTKFVFQVLAQLSENFIFIYLGMTLSTENNLKFKPLFILIAIFGICIARWAAVFPLSKAINWFVKYRARKRGLPDVGDEIPFAYQAMLFWAGLRGAVGVALAQGFTGGNGQVLKTTVLVVVVLTVIIFGGTTARMLEILGIRTGVIGEIDSDDEFDIEVDSGTFYKRGGVGNIPRGGPRNGLALSSLSRRSSDNGYTSGHVNAANNGRRLSPTGRPSNQKNLLGDLSTTTDDSDIESDSDLPPAAPRRRPSPLLEPPSGTPNGGNADMNFATTREALGQLWRGGAEDHNDWFKQLDEGIIKPWVLVPGQNKPSGDGHGEGSGGV
jgi:sodium/hydrogen exchanger-like protein 6/7